MKPNPSLPQASCRIQTSIFLRRWKHALLAGFFIFGIAGAAEAATITVDTNVQCNSLAAEPVNCEALGPIGDGDGDCSLGEAIVAANTDQAVDGCSPGSGHDLIVLGVAGPYVFTKIDNIDLEACDGPNALPNTQGVVRIEGNNETLVRGISLNSPSFFRLAHLFQGITTFNEVTVRNFNPGCDPVFCGNGVRESFRGEECDVIGDNVTDGVGCDEQCQLESCGNGELEPGEQCENGSLCSFSDGACLTASDCPGGNQCYDASFVPHGDDCTTDLECEGKWGMGSTCVFEAIETCDPDPNDGCTDNCESILLNNNTLCGNGIVDDGETCDNEGLCVSDDGIPYTSPSYPCTNDATCQSPDTGPGNSNDYCLAQSDDGCDANCQLETCGDGNVDPLEECDPGSLCSESGTTCATDDDCNPGVCAISGGSCQTQTDCPMGRSDTCDRTDVCQPRDIDGCDTSCRLETCDRCYDGGAFLVGSEKNSGPPAVLELHDSFVVANATLLSSDPLTINRADGMGGAIATAVGDMLPEVTITDTVLQGNAASAGGAIIALATNLSIANSTFDGNITIGDTSPETQSNGAEGTLSGVGGAIATLFSDVKIEQTALHHNSAQSFGGGIVSLCSGYDITDSSLFENTTDGFGGGFMTIMNPLLCVALVGGGGDNGGGGNDQPQTYHCTSIPFGPCNGPDDTFSCRGFDQLPGQCVADEVIPDDGDDEGGGGFLGGLFDDPVLLLDFLGNKTVEFKSSTFAGNYAHVQGGGIFVIDGGTLLPDIGVSLMNTILAENFTDAPSDSPNCDGILISEGHNLFGDLTGCVVPPHADDLYNANAGFDSPFCNVTDPTAGRQYCNLDCATSDALDRASLDGPSVDQLGVFRYPPDGTADIGAIERNDCDFCGNGVVEFPAESCDDGGVCSVSGTLCAGNVDCQNPTPGTCSVTTSQSCLADAECPSGETCAGVVADVCTPQPGDGCSATCILETCGNSVVDPGEDCDDGNLSNNDTCLNSCRNPECGDGITNNGPDETGAETCDDGNNVDYDFCRNNCTAAVCGDGFLSYQAGEECDDSNVVNGDGCSAACKDETTGGGETQPSCDHDNTIDAGEICDDGNLVNTDNCRNDCSENICGDTFIDADGPNNVEGDLDDQDCDDGNQNEHDGCTSGCKVAACGDGFLEFGVEQCDDGNLVNNDGCDSQCQNEFCGNSDVEALLGEECDPPNGTTCDFACHNIDPDEAFCGDTDTDLDRAEECDDGNGSDIDECVGCKLARCGDGVRHMVDDGLFTGDSALEQCDDGNNISGDGCSATCTNESCGDTVVQGSLGETCDPPNGTTCDAACHTLEADQPFCGDGTTGPGEECDDANLSDIDDCVGCRFARCGDGEHHTFDDLTLTNVLISALEECDDNNNTSNDGCSATCESETCGDNAVQPALGEECDNGIANGTLGNDCDDACHIIDASCGDGATDPGEECDNGAGNSNAQNATCRPGCIAQRCGDSIKDTSFGETCDDGNQSSGDGCSDTCTLEPPESLPTCGDGAQDPGEDCDDGNAVNTDGCSNQCHLPRCGDHITQAGIDEECDDGNAIASDACTNSCQLATCGDSIIQKTPVIDREECDDGDLNDQDDCKNDCTVPDCGDGMVSIYDGEECDPDDGVDYSTFGLVCVNCELEGGGNAPFCGNGVVNAGEECDDGNHVNTDACTNSCTNAVCGDDATGPGEECDDGNATDTDACTNACTDAVCGDGTVLSGVEQCDDGNTDNGDGCSSDCQNETPSTPSGEEPICGNGAVESGEDCDKGLENSDLPNASCRTDCSDRRCGDGVFDTAFEECDGNREDCNTECEIDLCFAIKEDAKRLNADNFTLLDFFEKYGIDPYTGHSPNEKVNECQPLAALGGGSNSNDFTVSNHSGGCSLTREPQAAGVLNLLLLIAMPGALLAAVRSRRSVRVRAVRRKRSR